MVEVTTKSIFGKKPLIEEQWDLYLVSEHIDFASAWLDPRVAGTDYMESILQNISKEKRHKKAREQYKRALNTLRSIM